MEYKINTGTIVTIKKGFMKGKLRIMYCGMPNESIFVLTPFVQNSMEYQGYSPAIFYSIANTVIQLLEMEFNVYEVHPDYIVIGD